MTGEFPERGNVSVWWRHHMISCRGWGKGNASYDTWWGWFSSLSQTNITRRKMLSQRIREITCEIMPCDAYIMCVLRHIQKFDMIAPQRRFIICLKKALDHFPNWMALYNFYDWATWQLIQFSLQIQHFLRIRQTVRVWSSLLWLNEGWFSPYHSHLLHSLRVLGSSYDFIRRMITFGRKLGW